MAREAQPSPPQWVKRRRYLDSQPDILDVAQEALPYIRGVLALIEQAELIDEWDSVKSLCERMEGSIARETALRAGSFTHGGQTIDYPTRTRE